MLTTSGTFWDWRSETYVYFTARLVKWAEVRKEPIGFIAILSRFLSLLMWMWTTMCNTMNVLERHSTYIRGCRGRITDGLLTRHRLRGLRGQGVIWNRVSEVTVNVCCLKVRAKGTNIEARRLLIAVVVSVHYVYIHRELHFQLCFLKQSNPESL